MYLCHLMNKDVIMSNISCTPSPAKIKVTFPWLLIGHLLPDLNHASFSQNLLVSHNTISTVRSIKNKHQANPSPKVLADSLIFSSSYSILSQLYLYITPLFCVKASLSYGASRRVFTVPYTLQSTCIPCVLQMLLKFSLSPLV